MFGEQPLKLGGNVASYFCTPEGQVVHAVLGPASADVLLREARWAISTYSSVVNAEPNMQRQRMSTLHAAAFRQPFQTAILAGAQVSEIHAYLAAHPLVPLIDAYNYIFEHLLHEPLNPTVELAERATMAIHSARKGTTRLLLIVHSDETDRRDVGAQWAKLLASTANKRGGLQALSRQYRVAVISRSFLESVSGKARLPERLVRNDVELLFVMVSGTDEAWETVSDWDPKSLQTMLARGLVASLHGKRPSMTEQRKLLALIGDNMQAARELQKLIDGGRRR